MTDHPFTVSGGGTLEFRILGPLEVYDGRAVLPVRGTRQRALLAVLLLHPNEVVPSERLIDHLWGDEPPQSAATALRVGISQLRKALAPAGAELVLTRASGYLVSADKDQLDAHRFERMLEEGRRQLADGAAERAASTLAAALELWRGPPLVDFTYEPFAQAEIARLEELQLTALEERIEADLALGRHDVVVGELEALIGRHRLRERLRGQLMLALYRAGRQAEALQAYRETRRLLVEELGIEPSPLLQRLEKAILLQDATLEPLERARERIAVPPAVPDHRPRRKLVTVVATNGPDGESAVPYVDTASETLVLHGGSVEPSRAGSIVGLFGVAGVREDDASRAVQAAVELRERAEDPGPTGISTGQLLVGAESEPLETRESPLVLAAHLRDIAARGEILVDEVTHQLVRHAVRLEASELEGSWRVLELIPEPPPLARIGDGPLIGRDFELEQLRRARARVISTRTSYLFTVLGDAGIGKSRLAREFAAGLDEDARPLIGRCVSHGEGLTFRPLQDVVAQAAGDVTREAILGQLGGDPDAPMIAGRVAAAIGSTGAAGSAEETFWAVRRLLEAIARRRPCVLVLEDLHSAQPTFLDLIEHLAEWTDAPLLLLCLARPELLEQRPSWGGGKANATSLKLEPLNPAETEALVHSLPRGAALGVEARLRIASAAAGNALFAEQLTASLADAIAPEGEISIPATIQALLAARLDRLGPGERAVIERAAVLGTDFSLGGVMELLPKEARAGARRHVQALIRKGFARQRASELPGDEDFRFVHNLMRDAAYRAMTGELRADVHERYGDWLARTAGKRIGEHAEAIGYHLEQAYRHREELGPVDQNSRRLATRAADHLATAGRQALGREDMSAAANLLGRARALRPADDAARDGLAPVLARALIEIAEFAAADAALSEALQAATASGDRALRAYALLGQIELGIPTAVAVAELLRLGEEASVEFERLGDDHALARTLWLLAKCHARRGRNLLRREALERALPRARRAHDEELEGDILHHLWWSVVAGPDAVENGQPYLDELRRLADRTGSPFRQSDLLAPLAYLRAIKGDFEAARNLVERAGAFLGDAGLPGLIEVAQLTGLIELLAGDAWASERATRSAFERAQALGYREGVVDNGMTLAQALYAQGRYEEAKRAARVARQNAAEGHLHPRILWRRIEAKVLALGGRFDDAGTLVEEAQALSDRMDDLRWQAATLLDVGEVLRLAGRNADAVVALERAMRLSERKGDDVSAAKARRVLSDRAQNG